MIPLQELTILPGGAAVLCRVIGEYIETLQELPFSFSERHVVGGNRWIVALVEESEHPLPDLLSPRQSKTEAYIYRAKVEQNGSVRRLQDIQLPSYILNQTLAIKGDVIYLGGYKVQRESKKKLSKVNKGEMAGFFDLTLEEPEWNGLPLPIDMQAGKSIDDVLVYNDKLVLVDNIMYPKYLFEYDISDPLVPVSTKTVDLPNNGTYEHIHRGSINNRWMALLSGGVGRGGSSTYVSVFNLPGYEQVFTVSKQDGRDFLMDRDKFTTLEKELEDARNAVELNDFAIAGDNLYVACGHHGIGVFPLQGYLQRYWQEQIRAEEEKESDLKRGWYIRSFFGSGYSLSDIYNDEQHLHKVEGLDDVHKLVTLADGRIIAISYGETNLKLDYKVLTFQTDGNITA